MSPCDAVHLAGQTLVAEADTVAPSCDHLLATDRDGRKATDVAVESKNRVVEEVLGKSVLPWTGRGQCSSRLAPVQVQSVPRQM